MPYAQQKEKVYQEWRKKTFPEEFEEEEVEAEAEEVKVEDDDE